MLEYYRARAPLMRYEALAPEVGRVLDAYAAYISDKLQDREILEVACGTGFWTEKLARRARFVVATDAAPEMLAIARARQYVRCNVELVLDDAYALRAVRDGFDGGVHFQWISHVPRARLPEFLALFHRKLSPGAQVVFGDNKDQGTQADADGNLYQERTLPDGSRHRVIKNWFQPEELRALLAPYAAVLEFEQFERDWFVAYRLQSEDRPTRR
jgi:demethylmenaquinone methyltransferase/2-methoxy-6-polyprenyl-1,4-benzoquinol methylase